MQRVMQSLLSVWVVTSASAKTSAPNEPRASTISRHHDIDQSKPLNAVSSNSSRSSKPAILLDRNRKHSSSSSSSKASYVDQKIHQPASNSMLPGIENSSTVSNCFTSMFGVVVAILLGLAASLAGLLLQQRRRELRLHTQVRAGLAKLHAEQRLLAGDSEKLKALEALKEDEKVLMRAIHDRGNVFYDESRRQFILRKEIVFMPEFHGSEKQFTRSSVVARFADPALAKAVLSDFAELLRIMSSAVVLIEGHTGGVSPQQMGDIEHDVADARAELIKSILTNLGIQEYRLATLGLPGFLGNGKDDVILKMVN